MSSAVKFGLIEATSPKERMSALFEFVNLWAGPRQPEFGETAERLATHQLPVPLAQLYEFAGRWPRKGQTIGEGFRWHLFAEQDALLPLDDLQLTENGKLIFLSENQGVWDCRTLCEGDDPPVWCRGERVENGVWVSSEKSVCGSLSKFLVSFVLQELVLGSPTWADSERLEEHFLNDIENAIPVWLNGPYVDGPRHCIYLWNNVLVGDLAGSVFFAAHDQAGEAFLINLGKPESEGEISQVTVSFGGKWILIVREDGSAHIVNLGDDGPKGIDAPSCSLNFDDVLESIGNVIADKKLPSRKVHVVLTYSTGISSPHEQLEDESVARKLFVRCLEFATDGIAFELRRWLDRDWPE